jgi:hypothetical protein
VWRSGSTQFGMIDTQAIRERWDTFGSKLDERGQRVFASGEVRLQATGPLRRRWRVRGGARDQIGGSMREIAPTPLPSH